MPQSRFNISKLLIPLFLLSVFLLSLTKTYDVDAWLHLTMGKAIWELKGFPDKDPFLYTMADKPFEYSSWLFGVIYYLAYKLVDTYGIILLKTSTITLAFYILLKDSLIEERKGGTAEGRKDKEPQTQILIAVAVLSVVAIIMRPRFVERPDTFLMVFLPFSIYSLNAYIHQGKKYIYSLPFIHLLWANSHSSINLMFVPFGAVLVGCLTELWSSRIEKRQSSITSSQIKTIFAVLTISIIVTMINPNFDKQFTSAISFMKKGMFKEYISELRPPTWADNPEFYFLSISVGISFIFKLGISAYKNKFYYQDIIRLLLAIPFFYLGNTSLRFIYIFVIVSGPIMVKNIIEIFYDFNFEKKFRYKSFNQYVFRLAALVIAAWIVFYSYSAFKKQWLFDKTYQEFGFGFKYDLVPENALRFMDKNNINGRVLNAFEWGQYITWRDFPKRQASIDGRGSVGEDLFGMHLFGIRYFQPLFLPNLYEKYGFESILLKVPNWTEDRKRFVLSDDWAIVYWDEISMLFLRRGGPYEYVIKKKEYKFNEVKTRLGETW